MSNTSGFATEPATAAHRWDGSPKQGLKFIDWIRASGHMAELGTCDCGDHCAIHIRAGTDFVLNAGEILRFNRHLHDFSKE